MASRSWWRGIPVLPSLTRVRNNSLAWAWCPRPRRRIRRFAPRVRFASITGSFLLGRSVPRCGRSGTWGRSPLGNPFRAAIPDSAGNGRSSYRTEDRLPSRCIYEVPKYRIWCFARSLMISDFAGQGRSVPLLSPPLLSWREQGHTKPRFLSRRTTFRPIRLSRDRCHRFPCQKRKILDPIKSGLNRLVFPLYQLNNSYGGWTLSPWESIFWALPYSRA